MIILEEVDPDAGAIREAYWIEYYRQDGANLLKVLRPSSEGHIPASPATHAPPAPERKEIQQWTVRLSKALIDHLKAVAYERGIHPRQLLEELAWQALTDRRASMSERRER
jgi:hypothetical protein